MSSRQNEKNGNNSSVKWNHCYPVQNWSCSLKSEAQPVATLYGHGCTQVHTADIRGTDGHITALRIGSHCKSANQNYKHNSGSQQWHHSGQANGNNNSHISLIHVNPNCTLQNVFHAGGCHWNSGVWYHGFSRTQSLNKW